MVLDPWPAYSIAPSQASPVHRKRQGKWRGFTLIETMICMLILAVLAAATAPGFSSMLKRQKVRSFASQLQTSLSLARAEAIARGEPVSVCPLDSAGRCTPGRDWTMGWQVQTGLIGVPNGPNAPSGVASGTVLRRVQLQGATLGILTFARQVSFSRLGTLQSAGCDDMPGLNCTWQVCPFEVAENCEGGLKVVVGPSGIVGRL